MDFVFPPQEQLGNEQHQSSGNCIKN